MSIQGSYYEVQESDGFVDVVLTRIGSIDLQIEGNLRALAGSAIGKECSLSYCSVTRHSLHGPYYALFACKIECLFNCKIEIDLHVYKIECLFKTRLSGLLFGVVAAQKPQMLCNLPVP